VIEEIVETVSDSKNKSQSYRVVSIFISSIMGFTLSINSVPKPKTIAYGKILSK
jgi:hypothetical protein